VWQASCENFLIALKAVVLIACGTSGGKWTMRLVRKLAGMLSSLLFGGLAIYGWFEFMGVRGRDYIMWHLPITILFTLLAVTIAHKTEL
jgi:hypothetical protein